MGKAMIPVSVIADLVCSELGDNTGAKKFMILQYIAMGFQEMNLFLNIDKSIKTQLIDLKGQNQFETECGFIYETKVGIRRKKTADRPEGKICTLRLNTDLEVSTKITNDSTTISEINSIIDGYEDDNCDCYYYNSPCGTLKGYGYGYANFGYYNIEDGMINISPFLYTLGDNLELVVEHVSDVFSLGVTLVPSESFACLHAFARARYFGEGERGVNQGRYEAQFNTLNRLYNFKPIDILAQLYQ